MRSAVELGKTLGVLVTLWAILAAVGWAAGAFPAVVASSPSSEPPPDAAVSGDAAAPIDGGAAGATDEEPDAWLDIADAGRVEILDVVRVCDAPRAAAWALGDLTGDARDEIVVSCARGIDVLSWPASGPPTRIARATPSRDAALVAAAIGDVDADGVSDMILALDDGLFFVPRDASGGFATAQTLAPARNGPVALASLDASPGLDVVAVHGADPRAELWLYRGGPTPVRADTTPAPLGTSALVVIDLDVDGHLDVVAIGSEQVLLAFGDSRASVARTRSLTPGGRGAVTIDANGDGALDVVIERDEGACSLAPSPALAETGECAPLPTLEPAARVLRAANGALVGLRHPDVVTWSAGAGTTTLSTMTTSRFGLHAAARIDAGLVLLGSSEDEDEAGRRWIELARAGEGARLSESSERSDPLDAPLVLEVALPHPDAP